MVSDYVQLVGNYNYFNYFNKKYAHTSHRSRKPVHEFNIYIYNYIYKYYSYSHSYSVCPNLIEIIEIIEMP